MSPNTISSTVRALSRRPLPHLIPHRNAFLPVTSLRHSSQIPPSPKPLTQSSDPLGTKKKKNFKNDYKSHRSAIPPPPNPPKAEYEMTFTCTPCSYRSSHRISKQGYHFGSVLITCPECRNRHVISDHLKVSCPSLEEV
jgi:protein import protein ZIM17